jgi:hypothetical protein
MTDLFQASLAVADVQLQASYHQEDMKYRKLEVLHRQIDEKLEQLRSIANLAALIAGFSLISLIEIQTAGPGNYQPVENPLGPNVPDGLIVAFTLCGGLVISLMAYSFVTCTLMLVGVLKAFDLQRASMPFPQFWITRCEEDWMRAFQSFTLGMPLFMVNLALAGWIKYWGNVWACSLLSLLCLLSIASLMHIHMKWGSYLAQEKDRDFFEHRRLLQEQQRARDIESGQGLSPVRAPGSTPRPDEGGGSGGGRGGGGVSLVQMGSRGAAEPEAGFFDVAYSGGPASPSRATAPAR